MSLSAMFLRPKSPGVFTPLSLPNLAVWLDAADSSTLYTTDAGPTVAVNSPLDIAGCALWLDGADSSASSMTLEGALVSAWRDKSGNGRDFTSTGTARPTLVASTIANKSALSFDGVDDRLSTSSVIATGGTAALTVFVVVRGTFPGNGSFLFTHRSGFGGADTNDVNIGWSANQGSSWAFGTLRSRVAALRSGVSYINDRQFQSVNVSGVGITSLTASFAATSSSNSHRWQGAESNAISGTSDAGSSVGMAIGVRPNATPDLFYLGNIAEVVAYSSALSSADRARVESYLAAKWGVSGVNAQASSTNDPVGAWLDKSGNGRHATQAITTERPRLTLNSLNSRPAITTRGVTLDGNRSIATAGWTYSTSNTAVFVFRAGGINQAIYQRGSLNTHPRSAVQQPGTTPFLRSTRVLATSGEQNSEAPYSYTTWGIGATIISQNSTQAYFTGVFAPELTGNGSTISGPLNLRLFSLPSSGTTGTIYVLDGGIAELVYYDRKLSSSEIASLASYLSAKWNISMPPQVSNADAQNWINRVYGNGGSVSGSTAAAVNTFCNAIDTAGIRDRFYRLNLFCGTGLNACLVPLYRGQSLSGTQLGGTTDTNNNFVAGDYAETGASGGLVGNGTTKFLDTGLALDALPTVATMHLATWIRAGAVTNVQRLIGAINSAATQQFYQDRRPTANGGDNGIIGGTGGAGDGVAGSDATNVMFLHSRTSSTAMTFYKNGVAQATQTANITPAAFASNIFVFCENRQGTGAITFANRRLAFYSIGDGMTASQITAFYNALNTFMGALSRT